MSEKEAGKRKSPGLGISLEYVLLFWGWGKGGVVRGEIGGCCLFGNIFREGKAGRGAGRVSLRRGLDLCFFRGRSSHQEDCQLGC